MVDGGMIFVVIELCEQYNSSYALTFYHMCSLPQPLEWFVMMETYV